MNFTSYVKAGYSLLWLQTTEEARAITELSVLVPSYTCSQWNIVQGLRKCNGTVMDEDCQDPISFFERVESLPQKSIVFAMDFHKFFTDITVIRKCKSIMENLRAKNKHIVFINHAMEIPPEMEKDITIFDFNMPSLDSLIETAKSLRDDNELEFKIDPRIISAAKGLTQMEAENAFARSIVETGTYDRSILDQEKLQTIRKSGLMEIWNPEPIENVGGFSIPKQYIYNRKRGFYDDELPTPNGILLTGLPGSGKSLFAKAISSVLDVPLIRLDLGTLKGGIVGESEANMKKATKLIDAIGECVVWMDEIEKALSGVQSSGKTDGGTGSNMFGQLLTWMQESQENHYIVATCNDIDDMLALSQGALIRRFDDIFFVDLPNPEEVDEIFNIMCKRYGIQGGMVELSDKHLNSSCLVGYTGAEIEKIVKSSLYDGFDTALKQVKPISQQNKAIIEKARKWAKNNAILANGPVEETLTGRKLG